MNSFFLQTESGRSLCWTETGDPDGIPVLHCHGGLSCRLEIAFADEPCRRAGVRWIAADRPGIGRSDSHLVETLADRARDLEALADHLGLSTFALSGWSAGVPHALAGAAALPARVTRVIAMAGLAPLRGPADIRALGMATDRFLFRVAPRAPALAAACLNPIRHTPFAVVRHALERMLSAGPDGQALPPDTASRTARAFLESVRPGTRGTVLDYALLARDWGFDPARLTTPVSIWHGREDDLLPVDHAHRLAATLSNATLHECEGVGHFLPQRELHAVWTGSGVSRSRISGFPSGVDET